MAAAIEEQPSLDWAGERGRRSGAVGQAGGARGPGEEEAAPAGRSVASPRRRAGKRGD